MIFSDIFVLFLGQNFKTKVLNVPKNLLLECLRVALEIFTSLTPGGSLALFWAIKTYGNVCRAAPGKASGLVKYFRGRF